MKKTLIATAVAAAVAAPLVAQADVTLYGRAMGSAGWMDSDAEGNSDNFFLSSHSSRIGVKGKEDLGGGLNAIFGIEWEVDITGRSRDLGARNRFVGLSSGFGTLLLARHDTPFKTVGRKINFFGDMLGDNRDATNFYASASIDTNGDGIPDRDIDGANAELRLDNVLGYVSPTWAGFHVFAAVSADHNQLGNTNSNQDDNNNKAVSTAAFYENGPFWLAGAYEWRDGVQDAATDKLWRVAAKYNWNNFTFGGTYQGMYNIGGNRVVADTNGDGVINADDKKLGDGGVWGVGGSYEFGNNKALVQYYRALELENLDNTDGGMLAVGLEHFFSKRTRAFATYEWVDAGSAVSYRLADNNGMGDEALETSRFGGDPMGFSIGVRHDF
jgi:predicted porin